MNVGKFVLYTSLGAFFWNVILSILGYLAHGQKDLIDKYAHELTLILLGLGLVFGIYLIIKGLKSKKLINQARRTVKKPVLNNIKDLVEETNIPRDMIEEFESFDEYEKLKIEEKALELCSKEMGVDINFLLAITYPHCLLLWVVKHYGLTGRPLLPYASIPVYLL